MDWDSEECSFPRLICNKSTLEFFSKNKISVLALKESGDDALNISSGGILLPEIFKPKMFSLELKQWFSRSLQWSFWSKLDIFFLI